MIKKTILAAGVAVVAMGTVAYAAPGMMKADAPKTLAEATTKADAMFDRMDANNDGKIDAADRAARQARMFDRIDTDKNGSISKAEFAAMHEMRGERRGAASTGGAHDGHRKGGGMMGKMADTNGDGTITRAEFDAGVKARFAKLDTNGDGTVSAAERTAARDQMRAERKDMRDARQAN